MLNNKKRLLKLTRGISAVLRESPCTIDEIMYAFAVNISFLLAELPASTRELGYRDLLGRIEKMIATAKIEGMKGADLDRRVEH
jgi:hypothetical protein